MKLSACTRVAPASWVRLSVAFDLATLLTRTLRDIDPLHVVQQFEQVVQRMHLVAGREALQRLRVVVLDLGLRPSLPGEAAGGRHRHQA